MEKVKSFNSIDEIQKFYLNNLFEFGEYITSRQLETIELCHINFCLENPLNRVTLNTARNFKIPLAIGEFAWHISGSNDLNFIAYYAREWKNISDDGKTIVGSCYGHKIFSRNSGRKNQWEKVVEILKSDKYSRRAILYLNDPENEFDVFSRDISCVSTIQFLVRSNKLDVIVNMRSNDIIWGMPYDIYLFTMIQEMLSIELQVDLGKYYHNVASLHIYQKHYGLGRKMLEAEFHIGENMKMQSLNDLKTFIFFEEKIRNSNVGMDEIENLTINNYWLKLLITLLKYKNEKNQLVINH